MIKRVNFTKRRRIPRDRVQIELLPGLPRRFTASLNLDGLSLSRSSAIFLEAMCAGSPVIERFPCGEVRQPLTLREKPLGEIEGENVFFTLKVVDRAERFGRIEGIAENIRPVRSKQESAGRKAILPIEPAKLGEQLWRLEFRQENVFLLVNSEVPGMVDRAHADPLFFALVYPEIVRQVLTRAFRENAEPEEEEERWPSYWLRFGRSLHPDRTNPAALIEEEDRGEWIDEVVKTFCDKHRLKDRYFQALGGLSEGEP